MRRTWRYIINSLAVLSLLMCLATLVLWVREADIIEAVVYRSRRVGHLFVASRPGIEYTRYPEDLDDPKTWGNPKVPSRPQGWSHGKEDYIRGGSGFVYWGSIRRGDFGVGFPYWFICLITAIMPSVWLIARLCHKSQLPGHCPICQYDLRATPTRCPECGHEPIRT